MERNKKIIIAITSCIYFLDIFYSLFFNIYILENVTSNVVYLFSYYIIGILIAIALYYPFYKILNKRTSVWLYRASFVFSFVIIILSMVINSRFAYSLILINSLRYVYNMCFYIPNEIATMANTTHKNVNKFLALKSVFNILVTVTFSIIVSYMFEHFNVVWLFAIMLIDVIAMFILSFFITQFGVNEGFKPVQFMRKARQSPHMKSMYLCHFFKRMSEAGVVQTLIPIMLYMKLGSEFSLGILASIASILTICALPIFIRAYKARHWTLIIGEILTITIAILLIAFTTPVVYIIYYFFNKIVVSLFTNAHHSSLFASIQYNNMANYRKEHSYFYGLIGLSAEIISYLVGIITCLILPLEYAIPTIICLFMFMQLISILFLKRSDRQVSNLTQETDNANIVE